MKARDLHDWDVTPEAAIAIQRRLAPLIVPEGDVADPRLIAGVDISIGGRDDDRPGLAAVIVLRWPGLEPVEQSVVRADVAFPYVPGLLSFREIPMLLPAFERLTRPPELIVIDGQGIAHPRRFGLAAHLGLLLDVPSIGCAKSLLIGRLAAPLGEERGATAPLVDRREVVGYAVRTRAGANPVYVSVGHRISPAAAARWVLDLAPRYRLPEPTRLAHQAAAGRQIAPAA